MSDVVFLFITPCSLVGGHRCFDGTYRLHLQGGTDENGGDTSVRNAGTAYKTTWCHNQEYNNL
jgi:hypothetical protein